MICINCSSNNWENVDQYRLVPKGMSVCKECGFISYPALWKSDEEIKAHYRTAYRNPPSAANFYTGQRKCHFHNHFLQSVFKEWKEKGLVNPSVYEVGAAFGMALAWFTKAYPGCKVGGTELTTSFRANAFYEFGISLEEDFDKTKKHDLIMSYKVAEHQTDAHLRIAEYAECLTDGGYLYISVPTWFDSLCNFGAPGFDLEYYYDTNHINVWTRETFENILLRAGFEIIKKDTVMYDSTYLCKRNDANKNLPVYKITLDEIKSKLEKTKAAHDYLQDGDIENAIKTWPDYPQAWATLVEKDRKAMFQQGWEYIHGTFIPKLLSSCNPTVSVFVMITDLAMRAKQWKAALYYCEEGLKRNPENPTSLQQLMNIMRETALSSDSDAKKHHYFEQAGNIARHGRNVSAQHFKEFTDAVYLYNSHLPLPKEPVL